jgi:hypothetical protein
MRKERGSHGQPGLMRDVGCHQFLHQLKLKL